MDVSAYNTKLKILWDELKNFQPILSCHCGGTESWLKYQQQECVLQFLMGLNESFAQTHTQIQLMDPILSISKVFSLVVQEERQRSISYGILSSLSPVGISGPSSSMAASNFTSKPRRDRPLYTHCGLQGHTMEKCYKLHGYPPGYKPKQKFSESKS